MSSFWSENHEILDFRKHVRSETRAKHVLFPTHFLGRAMFLLTFANDFLVRVAFWRDLAVFGSKSLK